MGKPIVRSGRFEAGSDLQCGENVVVEVAEEVIVGDRCVIPDNAYFGGRRVEIGDDFYGYGWKHPYFNGWPTLPLGRIPELVRGWLEIGRGRIDEEDAILTVGDRSTFHDNRIDLARRVTIGDDVGLSPEVVVYTHGYWQSVLEGFPCRHEQVRIGSYTIIGFRSVILPGASVGPGVVVGAQSVVSGSLGMRGIYGGSPARLIRDVEWPSPEERERMFRGLISEYTQTCDYRWLSVGIHHPYPLVYIDGCCINVEARILEGAETELTDDFRWFLFTRGVRIYTGRPFRKLGRKA